MIGVDNPASAPVSESIPFPFPNVAPRIRKARDFTTETRRHRGIAQKNRKQDNTADTTPDMYLDMNR